MHQTRDLVEYSGFQQTWHQRNKTPGKFTVKYQQTLSQDSTRYEAA